MCVCVCVCVCMCVYIYIYIYKIIYIADEAVVTSIETVDKPLEQNGDTSQAENKISNEGIFFKSYFEKLKYRTYHVFPFINFVKR